MMESAPGYGVFRDALADAFLRIDRYPKIRWTTDALIEALWQSLDTLRTNQDISQTDYDQACRLADDLKLTIVILRELASESSPPS